LTAAAPTPGDMPTLLTTTSQSEAPLPLEGVRVIELGNYIAAPTTGRLLADFGAEVIKIERPHTGDELRNWRLQKGSVSMLYRTINRNKKSVELDLRSEIGRQAILDLVRDSDVLLENFRPGTLERWGIGPDVLHAVNPDIIITRISAFGQTGPLAERPGFAAVAEAFSGFRNLVGDPDRAPVRVGVSIGDSIAGLYAAFGTAISLFQRLALRDAQHHATTGPDQTSDAEPASRSAAPNRMVDVALHEAMFSMLESLVPDYSAYGTERERTGGRMEGIAPSNAYLCGDGGSIVVAGNGDGIFKRYMEAIDRPDLAEDPDLQTNAGRWNRRDDLDAAIGAWTLTRTVSEALNTLDAAGVPAGAIHTAADIVNEPQFIARDMIQYREVSTGEETLTEVGFPGIVPVIGERSLPIRTLGPDLGAHTEEILGDRLGMSTADIRMATKKD
jgi:formyl-CoA transferase